MSIFDSLSHRQKVRIRHAVQERETWIQQMRAKVRKAAMVLAMGSILATAAAPILSNMHLAQLHTLRESRGIPNRPVMDIYPLNIPEQLLEQETAKSKWTDLVQATAPTVVITDIYASDSTKYAPFPVFFDCLSSTLNSGHFGNCTVRWTFTHSVVQSDTGTLAPFGVTPTMETHQYGKIACYQPRAAGTLTIKCEIWQNDGAYSSSTTTQAITANTWTDRYATIAANGGNNANAGTSSGVPWLLDATSLTWVNGGSDRRLFVEAGVTIDTPIGATTSLSFGTNGSRKVITTYNGSSRFTVTFATSDSTTFNCIAISSDVFNYFLCENMKVVIQDSPTSHTISALTRSGQIMTATSTAHGLPSGSQYSIKISGAAASDYNGTFGAVYFDANTMKFELPASSSSTSPDPNGGSITMVLCQNRNVWGISTFGTANCQKMALINCEGDNGKSFINHTIGTNIPDGLYVYGCKSRNMEGYGAFLQGTNQCFYNNDFAGSSLESTFRGNFHRSSVGWNKSDYHVVKVTSTGGKSSFRSMKGDYGHYFLNQFLGGVVEFCWDNNTSTPALCRWNTLEMNYITSSDIGGIQIGGPNGGSNNCCAAQNDVVRNNVLDNKSDAFSITAMINIVYPDYTAVAGTGQFTAGAGAVTNPSGMLVNVNQTAHGFSTGDLTATKSATQGQYNGLWRITKIDNDNFQYTVDSTPSATPATGTIIIKKSSGGDIQNIEILCNLFVNDNDKTVISDHPSPINIQVNGNIFTGSGTRAAGFMSIRKISEHFFNLNRWWGLATTDIVASINGTNVSYATFTGGTYGTVTNSVREAGLSNTSITGPTWRPDVATFTSLGGLSPISGVVLDALGNTRGATYYAGAVDADPLAGGSGVGSKGMFFCRR